MEKNNQRQKVAKMEDLHESPSKLKNEKNMVKQVKSHIEWIKEQYEENRCLKRELKKNKQRQDHAESEDLHDISWKMTNGKNMRKKNKSKDEISMKNKDTDQKIKNKVTQNLKIFMNWWKKTE